MTEEDIKELPSSIIIEQSIEQEESAAKEQEIEEEGFQLQGDIAYAGNFLDGSLTGKKGITYNQRASVCLETQKYPDTPNKAEWPSAVLRPGEKYTSQCIFKFSVDK